MGGLEPKNSSVKARYMDFFLQQSARLLGANQHNKVVFSNQKSCTALISYDCEVTD